MQGEIKKHIPKFEIDYHIDSRQQIADSWPQSIDDAAAQADWNWKPDYDLPMMTKGYDQQPQLIYLEPEAEINA